MKQHILALGAAAALFGFAGAAHAVVSFGAGAAATRPDPANPSLDAAPPQATQLEQNAGGIGHMLFAPYYNAQGNTVTLLNIANTDRKNGKAVKVRFRNASNSDDVLDFTLLLSPGDVWSGYVGTNTNGQPAIFTNDNSCVLPSAAMQSANGVPLVTNRLPQYLDPTVQDQLLREGYLEVLNMADIPPQTVEDEKGNKSNSALYTQSKHVNGVAPCDYSSDVLAELMDYDGATRFVAPTDAAKQYGLYAPTGGLMGSWIIQNFDLSNSYSGNMTAIRAVDDSGVPGYTNLTFAPQNGLPVTTADLAAQFGKAIDTQYAKQCANAEGAEVACVAGLTADPLLISNDVVAPLWFDFPDMSTPLLTSTKTPQDQVTGMDLEQNQLFNFYVSGSDMYTDWVVSQPTRRYYVAVDYAANKNQGGLLWNNQMGQDGSGGVTPDVVWRNPTQNPYSGVQLQQTAFGPMACLKTTETGMGLLNTEEGSVTAALGVGAFSPGVPPTVQTLCGEVMLLGFAQDSVFDARVTRQLWPLDDFSKMPSAGMAAITFTKNRLPVVGFAATAYSGPAAGNSFGATMAHRWN